MATATYTGTLIAVHCGHPDCAGLTFGMDEHFYEQRIRDHRDWWCPNGHCRHWAQENTEEKLRRRLANTEEDLRIARAARDTEERRARAYKGQVTKAMKRFTNGVCPCCKRTFPNVAAHMQEKHPEEVKASKARQN